MPRTSLELCWAAAHYRRPPVTNRSKRARSRSPVTFVWNSVEKDSLVSPSVSLFLHTVPIAANTHVEAQLTEHRGLHGKPHIGGRAVRRVHHLNVVGLVATHHLRLIRAIQDSVHDRPLRVRHSPAPLILFIGQGY